jgi:hypothetical protein
MPQGTCSIDGCGAAVLARGWCRIHYDRWRRLGDPLAEVRYRSASRPEGCSVSGCLAPGFRREWCVAHYSRWQRTGDPLGSRVPERAIEVFDRLVQIETDECVIWPGNIDAHGYGRVHFGGGSRKTHQLALERRFGRPAGLMACHRPGIGCQQLCMNYRHLYWGTNTDNMRDKIIDGTSRWQENRRRAQSSP